MTDRLTSLSISILLILMKIQFVVVATTIDRGFYFRSSLSRDSSSQTTDRLGSVGPDTLTLCHFSAIIDRSCAWRDRAKTDHFWMA